jgi:hypothetical protein
MVTMPAMMGDLIKRLAVGRVDLDIVAELNDRRAVAPRLTALRPGLVVIGIEHNENDAEVRALLRRLPTSKFIAVGSDGRMVGYELCLRRSRLSELSPDGLIGFIRAAPVEITAEGD